MGATPMITRRELLQRVLAAAAVGFQAQSRSPMYRGVRLGAQSYSFRDRPLDGVISGLQDVGLYGCELWQNHLEPRSVPRDELRRWRETTPDGFFRDVKAKFDRAGIAITAYNISFRDDFSDLELNRGFEAAKALGTSVITASANIKVMPRVAAAAAKHKTIVAVHNHSRIDPNEFATPDNFEAAMALGQQVAVNLDIGHFTAANFDAVAFLKKHHSRIVSLHIKDRKRDDGPNMPLGEGDTPIVPVLKMVRDNKWTMPVNIEYEYKGGDTIEEVRRMVAFIRKALDQGA
jgi:sugar phosphate isomerase/epimerase